MWNYSRPVPEYIHLNLQSWERASGGRCGKPVLVNRTNVKQWIPDAPDELFRVPYEAAESDAIRYALIYHNGGIYLDTDFLAVDMGSIIDRMADHDIITYTAEGQRFQKGQFSSNFLAGRKGSKVMGAIWKSQKEHLTQHCPKDAVPKSGMCCYDDPSVPCSVRWAGLGEGISHPALVKLLESNETFKSYIFDGDESFVPSGLVEVLKKKLSVSDALEYWKRRRVSNPLSRKLYHLFNSQGFADAYACYDLTSDNTTVAGALYKRSQVRRSIAAHGGPATKCANDGGLCRCTGNVFYGRRFACGGGSQQTDLATLLQTQHAVRAVDSEIRCSAQAFGGDPLWGVAKHCICAAPA